MKRQFRHRTASQSLAYPIKSFVTRFSLILLFAGALGLISIGRMAPQMLEAVRIRVMDMTSMSLQFASLPWNLALDAGRYLNELVYIHEENAFLLRENKRLKSEILEARNVFYENQELRRLLDMTKVLPNKIQSARVVANTSDSFYRTVLLDAGTSHGIKKGQAVINDRGLIGRIIESGKYSSRVLLLSDVNSRVPVRLTKSRIRSILSGKNGERLELLYLPPQHHLSVGEMIVTTGDGHIFPAGVPVAMIEEVTPRLKVVPLASFSQLDFVSVIQP